MRGGTSFLPFTSIICLLTCIWVLAKNSEHIYELTYIVVSCYEYHRIFGLTSSTIHCLQALGFITENFTMSGLSSSRIQWQIWLGSTSQNSVGQHFACLSPSSQKRLQVVSPTKVLLQKFVLNMHLIVALKNPYLNCCVFGALWKLELTCVGY